jgi:hypothetical protein
VSVWLIHTLLNVQILQEKLANAKFQLCCFFQKRFEELATAFKTDHEKLDFRSDLTKKEYDNARKRVSEISSSLKQTMLVRKVLELRAEIWIEWRFIYVYVNL